MSHEMSSRPTASQPVGVVVAPVIDNRSPFAGRSAGAAGAAAQLSPSTETQLRASLPWLPTARMPPGPTLKPAIDEPGPKSGWRCQARPSLESRITAAPSSDMPAAMNRSPVQASDEESTPVRAAWATTRCQPSAVVDGAALGLAVGGFANGLAGIEAETWLGAADGGTGVPAVGAGEIPALQPATRTTIRLAWANRQ